MNDDVQTRVEALEISFSHQESTLDELTLVLLAQEKLVKRQGEAIKLLESKISSLTTAPDGAPQDEAPPPHY